MNTPSVRTRLVLVLALFVFAVFGATSTAFACVVGAGTSTSCTEAALNACLPGGGTFDGTVTFNCGGAATIIVTSTKTISADTAIDGGDVITISGGNAVTVFLVNSNAAFTVENLTITNGLSTSNVSSAIAGGGGNTGSAGRALTVINSTVSGNNGGVGAVGFNTGTLTVMNSTFSGNSGTEGTIDISPGPATATVTNCIFVANTFGAAGGIANFGGTLTVANSTFFGNSGSGAISNGSASTVTVVNSTFSGNSGGAIGNAGTATVTNSILFSNSTPGPNCSGLITDGGHNIDDGTTCGFTGAGCASTTGTSFCNTNPLLDPAGLGSNGGPTQTIALKSESPAINAGDETVCAAPPVEHLDQRGFVRPGVGATNCSIGAYEFNAGPPSPVATVFVSQLNGDIQQVTVSNGTHNVVGSTGVGSADSLVFEASGKLLVSGNTNVNVFRIDPSLPGGAANTGSQINSTSLSGPLAADEAIDSTGTKLYVTDYTGQTLDVVALTTGAVSAHTLTGLSELSGIAFDAFGQLWVADPSGHTVGIADLTANTYTPLCAGVAAGLGAPDGLSFDPSSGKLYVSGRETNTVTELTIGIGTCAAGTVFSMGTDHSGSIISPDGIAADGRGGVFAAGMNGDVVRLDTTTGAVTIIASGISGLDDIAPVFGTGAPPTTTTTSSSTTSSTTTSTTSSTTTPTSTSSTTSTTTSSTTSTMRLTITTTSTTTSTTSTTHATTTTTSTTTTTRPTTTTTSSTTTTHVPTTTTATTTTSTSTTIHPTTTSTTTKPPTTTTTTSTTSTQPPTTSTAITTGNRSPDCSAAAASPATLWPPNHQFVDVSVVGVTDPDGDPVAITITGVTQDEPLNGGGSGNTCPDATGVGTATASLRAEREGTGDGRVYHIGFTGDDGRGGRCTGTATVCVPHDQAGQACVDQGPLVDSTGPTCVGACTSGCAIEMAVAQPVCTGENLPAALTQHLDAAQQLIAQAAGTSGKKKAKRLMRRGIKAMKQAVGIATKDAKKGTVSSGCAAAVAMEFGNAKAGADQWLRTR